MSLLTWEPSMSVGVIVLDEDHKKLIAMINELQAGMLAGHGHDAVGTILRRLANYTVEHFQREERLLAETGYPGIAGHRSEHEKLKNQVMAEIQKFQAGGEGLGRETLIFLRDWGQHHSQECDKAYTPHLTARGVR